jgi:hypothetical protein
VLSAVPPGSSDSPSVIYHAAHREPGRFLSGWTATLPADRFAKVQARHAGQPQAQYTKATFALLEEDTSLGIAGGAGIASYAGPFKRTEYYFGPGFLWNRRLDHLAVMGTRLEVASWLDDLRTYRAGVSYAEGWNRAPFAPALADHPSPTPPAQLNGSATRRGDDLTLRPSLFSDQSSPAHRSVVGAWDHRRERLLRDGQAVIDRIDEPDRRVFVPIGVPPEPATYRYEVSMSRGSDIFELSTQVDAAWTFRSEHVAGSTPESLPLMTLRWSPDLDENNHTSRRVMILPARIDRTKAATSAIASVEVDASFDDGATWSRVPGVVLADHWLGIVAHPRHAAFVSLRATVRAVDGSQAEQTVLRAYGLTP